TMAKFAIERLVHPRMHRYARTLATLAAQWNLLTMRIMLAARKDRDVVSSACHHFLMYSGYVTMAYFWALQAEVAYEKLEKKDGAEKPEFYKAKIGMARFYFDHLLPRAEGHATSMLRPSKSLTRLPVESFVFE
ncbi:MAG: acyl-CoA dehydrogenase C-terminal domain-containing protein, partial [Nevskiales bacterium]